MKLIKLIDMTLTESAALRESAARARREYGIADGEAVHLDIPLTAAHTAALLKEAGFSEVEKIFSEGATTVLLAKL